MYPAGIHVVLYFYKLSDIIVAEPEIILKKVMRCRS